MKMDIINTTLDNFTKDDFLASGSSPFKWLDQFRGDHLELIKKTAQLKEYAKQCGIGAKLFNDLLNAYELKNVHTASTMQTYLYRETQEDDGLLLTTGKYVISDDGVEVVNGFGMHLVVCPHPIIPIKRLVNVDTGEERLQLAYKRGTMRKWRKIIVEKSVLASTAKIVDLAASGIVVNSANAKALSVYLMEIEDENYDDIPEEKSVGRLGWTDKDGFSPYVEGLTFDGEVSYKHIFNAVRSEGNRDVWVREMKRLRALRGPGRILLAASFASALVEPCGQLPFFVHAWGSTEIGKTVGLMVAASVWADPRIGEYVTTFNSTSVGQELSAGVLNSLPLILDELQIRSSAGQKDFDKIIYQLTEGTGRTRGAKTGGLQKQTRWRNAIITSGEHPISTSTSGGGAVNRIIQVEIEDKIHPDLPGLCRIITQNFGHAGRELIEHLQNGGMEKALELQQRFYKELLNTSSTDKQAGAGSVILMADAVVTDLIFKDGYALTVEDMTKLMTSKDDVDVNRRALQYIFDIVGANPGRFEPKPDVEVWGKLTDTGDKKELSFITKYFDDIVTDAGFNSEAFRAWAHRHGLLITDPNRRTRRARINSGIVNTICINMLAAESLLNPENTSEFERLPDDIPF